ncbi:hypothetical protein ACOSP7_020762 [Xanthoceras sorbifolium]
MDTNPPIRKPTWKRRARTSNDSRSFESCWANLEDCRAIIQRSWAGMANGPLRLAVPSKLRQCAISLDAWNRSSLQILCREIARIRGQIRVFGLQVTASSWYELRVQERKLDDLLRQDEEYWRQRARTFWLASGDKNTKYFHFKSNQKRKRNSLLGLLILLGNGSLVQLIWR